MLENIKKKFTLSDYFFSIPILTTIVSVIFIVLLFLILFSRIPDKLPLFYSLPWGEAQLATKQQFFLLPVILTLVCLTNSLIASLLHPTQYMLKRIIMLSLFLINFIILITAVKILWIFI